MKTDEGTQCFTLDAAKSASSACVCLFKWT